MLVSTLFIAKPASLPLPIFLALLIVGNLVPDYVSLLETRYLVRKLVNSQTVSLTKLFAFLICDLVATFIIFNVLYAPIEYIFYAYRDGLAVYELWRSLVGNFMVSFAYLRTLISTGNRVCGSKTCAVLFNLCNICMDLVVHPGHPSFAVRVSGLVECMAMAT